MTLPEVERVAVVEALKAEGWNQTRAAERLGITRRQLRTKMEKFHLL
jgi:DNA-binding protein Fis